MKKYLKAVLIMSVLYIVEFLILPRILAPSYLKLGAYTTNVTGITAAVIMELLGCSVFSELIADLFYMLFIWIYAEPGIYGIGMWFNGYSKEAAVLHIISFGLGVFVCQLIVKGIFKLGRKIKTIYINRRSE